MFEYKKTHSGQYRRYDDSFDEWDIVTDIPEQAVRQACLDRFNSGTDLPSHSEWKRAICIGGPKDNDAVFYFSGWHDLHKTGDGTYHFTICRPFCD